MSGGYITHLSLVLLLDRPQGPGCAACGRPWSAHEPMLPPAACGRCSAWFDFDCYLARVAAADEVLRLEDPDDDEMAGHMFLCRGCRS